MYKKGQSQLRKGRVSEPGRIYHVVSNTRQRTDFFADWSCASAACRAFTSTEALADARLLCWVLMPDHVHWLLQLGEQAGLSMTVQRMKGLSSHAVSTIRGNEKIWAKGFYERAVRREEDLLSVARYIVANPLRSSLCQSLRQYPYWDAVYL